MLMLFLEKVGDFKTGSSRAAFNERNGWGKVISGEKLGLGHGEPHRFFHWPRRNSKGRELKTAVRRQAYFPYGYFISLLPT